MSNLSNSTIALPPLLPGDEKASQRQTGLDLQLHKLNGLLQRLKRPLYERESKKILFKVHEYLSEIEMMDDVSLCHQARHAGSRLRIDGWSDLLLVSRFFALLSAVSSRTLGLLPHEEQLAAMRVILDGRLAEMATGEGKTLVAGLAAAAGALSGRSVHVVTVNDYLAMRDAASMKPLFDFLKLSVGIVVKETAAELRASEYGNPVCYCTNKELAFDYLRDSASDAVRGRQSSLSVDRLLPQKHNRRRIRALDFAIVDEVDSVLVDEARTPLILSQGADKTIGDLEIEQVMNFAQSLQDKRHFVINELSSSVVLTSRGLEAVSRAFADVEEGLLYLDQLREELVVQALTALHVFIRNDHYLVRDGKVVIIDEYTGRVMPDRSWSAGLHQMVEFKEGCELSEPNATIARMTYQRFFRRYQTLSGMTGTAYEVRRELWNVYGLQVLPIATHRPSLRKILPDRVYKNRQEKFEALAERVITLHEKGVPLLIGTRSVSANREVCAILDRCGLSIESLHAADDALEAEIVAAAGERGKITVVTNMAGRGTDISLQPGVETLGGLCVIMTERHDAGRIDRQLMGRCARQGDPGIFEVLQSLEDPLAMLIRPRWLVALASYLVPFDRGQIARMLLLWAQKRLEKEHSNVRERLLKSDQSESDLLAFSGRLE